MIRAFITALCCALLSATAIGMDGVRVLTYNIRFSGGDGGTPNKWTDRCDDLVSLIRRLDVDIGGLQEVCPNQIQYLCEQFPDYSFVGEHRECDRVSGEASPVFYRRQRFSLEKEGTFWLSETPDAPGSKGWGAYSPRICSYVVLRERTSGCRFVCANLHADNRSATAREKGLSIVLDRMKGLCVGLPILLTGDFNCRETDVAVAVVSGMLKNVLDISETPPKGPWRSFNGWRWRDSEVLATSALKLSPEGRNNNRDFYEQCGGSRIDYIFVSSGIRVKSVETVASSRCGMKRYPSDHFPVVAEVLLAN